MRKHFNIVLATILFLVITGCSGWESTVVKTYQDSTISDDQVAIFSYLFFRQEHAVTIDKKLYTSASGYEFKHFRVLPGKHHIRFLTSQRLVGFVEGYCELDMKAGHHYIFTSESVNGGILSPQYTADVYLWDKSKKEKIKCHRKWEAHYIIRDFPHD